MSDDALKIILSANAEISAFLKQFPADGPTHHDPDGLLSVIDTRLPSIAATISKAGFAIGPLVLSDNLDQESRAQLDLYTENLRKLKALLSPLLVIAEERRKQLADNAGKARETLSWLSTLRSTIVD